MNENDELEANVNQSDDRQPITMSQFKLGLPILLLTLAFVCGVLALSGVAG